MRPIKSGFAQISNWIRVLSSKLGKAPTLLYLLGYLIVIFAFSLVYYYGLPGKHFYHSTSQYEYEFFNNDANDILHDIRAEIMQVYLENGDAQRDTNGWQMNINDLEIHSLFVGNFPSEFGFQIRIPITHATEGQVDSWTSLSAKVTVFTDGKIVIDNTVYLLFIIENSFNIPIEGIPSPEILFPHRAFEQQENPVLLPLSLDLYNRIIGFGQGYRGFPSRVSGQYLRMLYLSTGIATSSAFGDIVPISTQARLLVTTEAIIAVVMIGLFLNSLVYGIGKALQKAPVDNLTSSQNVSGANEERPTKHAADGGESAASQSAPIPKKIPTPKSRRGPRSRPD